MYLYDMKKMFEYIMEDMCIERYEILSQLNTILFVDS